LLADHYAEGAQIINSAPIQAARRTSRMTIDCPAVASQLGMACSTNLAVPVSSRGPALAGQDPILPGLGSGSPLGRPPTNLGRPAGLLPVAHPCGDDAGPGSARNSYPVGCLGGGQGCEGRLGMGVSGCRANDAAGAAWDRVSRCWRWWWPPVWGARTADRPRPLRQLRR